MGRNLSLDAGFSESGVGQVYAAQQPTGQPPPGQTRTRLPGLPRTSWTL